MIAPRTIAQMTAQSPVRAARDAMVAKLTELMTGVTVVSHPGKIDIADVVAKAIVAAPGVAIGWSRIRVPRWIDGSWTLTVDWTAYIVAEDHADQVVKRRTGKEEVAHGIGIFLLEILGDDISNWGIAGLTGPEATPELKPVFTAKSFEEGAVYYAVTWAQTFVAKGQGYFEGPTPATGQDETGGYVDFGEGGIPAAARAWFKDEPEGED